MKKRSVLVFLLLVLVFLGMLRNAEEGYCDRGKAHLEEVLRRTAVTCYASEGFYPPSLSYMRDRYGLQYDESRYTVHYRVFASNLMPDITVLEVLP